MLICFVTSGLEFSGDALTRGGLGGSETALLCVAREFAKLGHAVRVYCNCKNEGNYDGVRYLHYKNFKQQGAHAEFDVVIASRWSEFLTYKVPAGLRVLWCHDILTAAEDLMPGLWQTDMLMLLSDFQIEQYCQLVPELRKHIWKTSNGVDLDLIAKCKRPKVKKKIIYTSRPERGLPYLLEEVLPKILERHPDAKLYCAAYKNDQIAKDDPVLELVRDSERLAQKYPNNVVLMGSLTKEQLYCQISSSQLMVFPTSFPEIFMIGGAESQACETPIITTDAFALSETVGPNSGLKIDGLPGDAFYASRFADAVCDLLDNPERLAQMGSEGPKWIAEQGYSWEAVAKSWEDKFEEVLSNRWDNNQSKVLQELERRSDLLPAKALADEIGDTEAAARIKSKIADYYEPIDSVRDRFEAAIPRFHLLSEIATIMGQGKKKKILDYRADQVAFGLVAAKEFPESEITILAQDEKIAVALKENVSKAGLKNVRVIDKLAADESFDFVVADEKIDSCTVPAHAIKSLMAWTKQGGLVGFTSRYGAKTATYASSIPDRLWNLDQADFRKMFADKELDHHLSFHADGISEGGDLFGHWCVCVRRSVKIESPDICGRKIRTRPYKSLAVCMIAKNEEEWMTGCLKSVAKIADRIVVADTGSSDCTINRAKDFGAEIRQVPFRDFSQARNESIANIKEDWIFWLDADERLVSADALRKYLHSEIFEAYVVRQHHLMIDKPSAFDSPIRLFKNKPQYKFTGKIHEQVDCVDVHPFDDSVNPAFVIEDADLAHYGYVNERLRRQKTSNRNMRLLIQDAHENPERMLTWMLVMRDYLNLLKWWKDRGGGAIEEGSFWHSCLEATIATYHAKFADRKHRFHKIAEPLYLEALRWLGLNGLCYKDLPTPPFEIRMLLSGAIGGLGKSDVKPEFKWFLCQDEYRLYLEAKGAQLGASLFGGGWTSTPFVLDSELPDPEAILRHACNMFENRPA